MPSKQYKKTKKESSLHHASGKGSKSPVKSKGRQIEGGCPPFTPYTRQRGNVQQEIAMLRNEKLPDGKLHVSILLAWIKAWLGIRRLKIPAKVTGEGRTEHPSES
ncbi:hypothetical protein MGYG_09161 [Nannizzia gypsea CBS 118893]|uniref:Uncharacterized protein n=1 Tax=Arthroderma gypseum (strain ATCC MYA-4604 / CBS 118893) TaxID=535722 RepID=E4V3R4_ARTGP|nr:hypothetical protein MGYG_09161 [Nannizzia gypsea CBS 118893]EFR04638.1 hypothetical protein MGYG_09161 [Nannizzia gypsea CBS 118893]